MTAAWRHGNIAAVGLFNTLIIFLKDTSISLFALGDIKVSSKVSLLIKEEALEKKA